MLRGSRVGRVDSLRFVLYSSLQRGGCSVPSRAHRNPGEQNKKGVQGCKTGWAVEAATRQHLGLFCDLADALTTVRIHQDWEPYSSISRNWFRRQTHVYMMFLFGDPSWEFHVPSQGTICRHSEATLCTHTNWQTPRSVSRRNCSGKGTVGVLQTKAKLSGFRFASDTDRYVLN